MVFNLGFSYSPLETSHSSCLSSVAGWMVDFVTKESGRIWLRGHCDSVKPSTAKQKPNIPV